MFPKIVSIPIPDFLHGILPEHITLYSYGLMIGLGIFAGFWVALFQVRKFGVDSEQLSSLLLWIVLAAFIGGKLFYYLEDPSKYLSNPSLMLQIKGGGFVFYGSLIFALPTIYFWLKSKKLPVRPFMDVFAFVTPVVHSFGRIGCFLAGCCHGKVCHNAFGVTFTHPDSLAEPLNVPLYPTQLFDIFINVVILITLLIYRKRKKFEGQLMLIYIAMYAVGRSINEEFRGDEARGYVFDGWFSHSQAIAVLMIIGVIWLWNKWSKNPVIEPNSNK
jgi:phosphatidylglycerol:prolipoprotein diacylglycerol transferase